MKEFNFDLEERLTRLEKDVEVLDKKVKELSEAVDMFCEQNDDSTKTNIENDWK